MIQYFRQHSVTSEGAALGLTEVKVDSTWEVHSNLVFFTFSFHSYLFMVFVGGPECCSMHVTVRGQLVGETSSVKWVPVTNLTLSGLATSPSDLLNHLAGPHFPL